MNKNPKFTQMQLFNFLLMTFVFFIVFNTPAFADLTSSMEDLQSRVRAICTPLAIIFLIIAGMQKAMGNNQIFVFALVGTIIMFGAPQIVSFISAAFGG